MGIVERHFSNPCVKEHLQQAISAMERDHLQTPTSPQVHVQQSILVSSFVCVIVSVHPMV